MVSRTPCFMLHFDDRRINFTERHVLFSKTWDQWLRPLTDQSAYWGDKPSEKCGHFSQTYSQLGLKLCGLTVAELVCFAVPYVSEGPHKCSSVWICVICTL